VRSISRAESACCNEFPGGAAFALSMVRSEAEFFASYLQEFPGNASAPALRAVKNSSSKERGKLTIDQFERLKELQSEYEQSRAKLVARIGEEAALRLDEVADWIIFFPFF
jgi:hypothetical protein